MSVIKVRKTLLESQPREVRPVIHRSPPPVNTQVPIQYLDVPKKSVSGLAYVGIRGKPDVYVEPCYSKKTDTYTLFRGPIFQAQGGQIPDYVGRVNVMLQNDSGFNIWIADSFDIAKAAATPCRGYRLSDGESMSLNLVEYQEFYADNLASAATIRVNVLQMLKTR